MRPATDQSYSGEQGGLYRLLVESVADYAIFALDASGRIITWNRGAQRIKGYAPEQIIGNHFSIFYPPEDIANKKPEWELQVAIREGSVEDEGWRVRRDGSRFWASVVITALRNPAGEVTGFAKVTRDLTERRRAEEALRESEQRFRLMVQNVEDYGIFMLDSRGRVSSWNDGAQRIKGYKSTEIIGQHFSTFYPAEDVARGKPGWELDAARAGGRYEDEGWRVRKDGNLFWASVVITALRDEDGRLIGFAKVTRDLTERRAAQERAIADARRVAEAEASTRTRTEFLAAMSHELRTPLNAIGGYAELLEIGIAGPTSEQQQDYLTRIRSAQQHLLGIINDLLNYSRIEAGHVTYEMKTVPLNDVVDRVTAMILPQATMKSIELVRGPCPPELRARADRLKLEQILINLLSNAVKFTPSGGKVHVHCSIVGDAPRVTVRDTGPGIPEEAREKIFEPFVQLGRSHTSQQEGTGLGLAISRDLARAMGGNLTVGGKPGTGAEFALTLLGG